MKFVFLMFVLTFFLATSSLSSFVSASSAGAGTCNAAVAAVQNMPGSSNVQTLGYGVSFGSSTSYTAGGGNVALTISGSGNYTGFLIYATTSSGTRVGTWTTANGVSQIGSSVACSTDTSVTTHTSANPKPVSTVHSWVPPTTSSGPVTFNVVVMLANRQFQVYTQTLSDSASSTTAPPAGSTTSTPGAGSTTSTPGAAAASFVSSPVLSLAALLMAVIAVAFARV